MNPTSVRQYWETIMHHDKGELSEKIVEAKQIMNNAMDHGGGVGIKHYAKGKARKVAEDSKACTIGYYNGLIPWPTAELTEEFFKVNMIALKAKFSVLKESEMKQEIKKEPMHAEVEAGNVVPWAPVVKQELSFDDEQSIWALEHADRGAVPPAVHVKDTMSFVNGPICEVTNPG